MVMPAIPHLDILDSMVITLDVQRELLSTAALPDGFQCEGGPLVLKDGWKLRPNADDNVQYWMMNGTPALFHAHFGRRMTPEAHNKVVYIMGGYVWTLSTFKPHDGGSWTVGVTRPLPSGDSAQDTAATLQHCTKELPSTPEAPLCEGFYYPELEGGISTHPWVQYWEIGGNVYLIDAPCGAREPPTGESRTVNLGTHNSQAVTLLAVGTESQGEREGKVRATINGSKPPQVEAAGYIKKEKAGGPSCFKGPKKECPSV